MKNLIFLFVLLLSSVQVFSQNNDITIYVANHKGEIKTVSLGITECYLVKESKTAEWQNFNGVIEGLEYKEGYEYELQVLRIVALNPPADLPIYYYKLKSIINKTPTMIISSGDRKKLEGVKFSIKKLRIDGALQQVSDNKMILSFLLNNNTVSGNDGCNDFMGRIEINKNKIKFLNLSGTKMFCADSKTDKIFNELIYKVNKFKLTKNNLKLYEGKKLLFEYEIVN